MCLPLLGHTQGQTEATGLPSYEPPAHAVLWVVLQVGRELCVTAAYKPTVTLHVHCGTHVTMQKSYQALAWKHVVHHISKACMACSLCPAAVDADHRTHAGCSLLPPHGWCLMLDAILFTFPSQVVGATLLVARAE